MERKKLKVSFLGAPEAFEYHSHQRVGCMPGDLSDLQRFLDEPVPPLAAWHWQTLRSMAQTPELVSDMSTQDVIRFVFRTAERIRQRLAQRALFHDFKGYDGPTEFLLNRPVYLGPFHWLSPSIVSSKESLWRDDSGEFVRIPSAERAALSETLTRLRVLDTIESQVVLRTGSWFVENDTCSLRLNAPSVRFGERPGLQLLDVGTQPSPTTKNGEWLLGHNVRIIDVGEWAKFDPTFQTETPAFYLNETGEWEQLLRFPIDLTAQGVWIFRQWHTMGMRFGRDNAMRFASIATQCSLPLLPTHSSARTTDTIREFCHQAAGLPAEMFNDAIATFSGNVASFAAHDVR